MTPDAAVAQLAGIIASRSEFTEDEIYTAMVEAGIPLGAADRAYKFTQIAWGQVFLDGLRITFAPDYMCFNGAGEVIESGLLAEQPYFMAAMALAKKHPLPAGLPRLAMMSADVNSINNALNAGSKPENLVTGSYGLFMEPPTSAGLAKAQQKITERFATKSKKPWWRFW